MSMQQDVFEALANAKDNGYDFAYSPPDEVVMDMMACAAEFEQCLPWQVRLYVEQWQKQERQCQQNHN